MDRILETIVRRIGEKSRIKEVELKESGVLSENRWGGIDFKCLDYSFLHCREQYFLRFISHGWTEVPGNHRNWTRGVSLSLRFKIAERLSLFFVYRGGSLGNVTLADAYIYNGLLFKRYDLNTEGMPENFGLERFRRILEAYEQKHGSLSFEKGLKLIGETS